MDSRRRFGNASEVSAARHLERKGYKILAHQFRTSHGEIDLIAEKDGELVFVEVKARKNLSFGYPETAVGKKKLLKMSAVAEIYMEQEKLIDKPFRFDIVAILKLPNKTMEIEHLEAVHKLRYILQSLETQGICKLNDYRIELKDLSD